MMMGSQIIHQIINIVMQISLKEPGIESLLLLSNLLGLPLLLLDSLHLHFLSLHQVRMLDIDGIGLGLVHGWWGRC